MAISKKEKYAKYTNTQNTFKIQWNYNAVPKCTLEIQWEYNENTMQYTKLHKTQLQYKEMQVNRRECTRHTNIEGNTRVCM